MNFEEILRAAQQGDHTAVDAIFWMYRPLLIKRSILNGMFDEDLYQELAITLLRCIRKFHM